MIIIVAVTKGKKRLRMQEKKCYKPLQDAQKGKILRYIGGNVKEILIIIF